MSDDDDLALRRQLAALEVAPNCTVEAARRNVTSRIASRRTRRTAAGGGVAVVAVIAALVVGSRFGNSPTAARAPAPPTTVADAVGELRLLAIEARGGPAGTERVTLEFSGPLPEQGPADYSPSARSAPDDRVVFTTQTSGTLQICGNPHSAEGATTVDLLAPAAWLDPHRGLTDYVMRRDPPSDEDFFFDGIGKIITCWNTEGFVQIVVFGTASSDPGDISVDVIDNRIILDASGE